MNNIGVFGFDFFVIVLSILGINIATNNQMTAPLFLFLLTILFEVIYLYFHESCLKHITKLTHGLKLVSGILWVLGWIFLIKPIIQG